MHGLDYWIFNDVMHPARLRSQQRSRKINELGDNSGNRYQRSVLIAHLGTYEDMLIANNTDLNRRSATFLAGT